MVRWSANAKLQHLNQLEYLTREAGEGVAEAFNRALDSAIARLLQFPAMGSPRPMPDYMLPLLRMWQITDFPNHLILYEPTDEGLEIVALIHSSQDYYRMIQQMNNQ